MGFQEKDSSLQGVASEQKTKTLVTMSFGRDKTKVQMFGQLEKPKQLIPSVKHGDGGSDELVLPTQEVGTPLSLS